MQSGELITAGDRAIRSELHTFINYIWNKEDLFEQQKESITVPIYKKGDKTDCSNYRGVSLSSTTWQNSIQHPAVKFNSIYRGNYWG